MSLSGGGRDPLLSDLCQYLLTAVALWLAVTWLYVLSWGVLSRLKRAKSLQAKPGLQTLAFSVVWWNSSCRPCTANGDPGLGRKLFPAKLLPPACVTHCEALLVCVQHGPCCITAQAACSGTVRKPFSRLIYWPTGGLQLCAEQVYRVWLGKGKTSTAEAGQGISSWILTQEH